MHVFEKFRLQSDPAVFSLPSHIVAKGKVETRRYLIQQLRVTLAQLYFHDMPFDDLKDEIDWHLDKFDTPAERSKAS